MSALEQLFEQNFIKEAITQFVRKVYLMLDNRAYEEAMGWDSDNHTIVIKDTEKLIDDVLPVVFKQNTLKSFIRQLNMYNFKKIKHGRNPKYMYFRNPHFHRGNMYTIPQVSQQLIFIKRKQRGYIEKSRLQNIESKTMLEKYNIFSAGVMNRLREQFTSLCEADPKIGVELISLVKSVNNTEPEPETTPRLGSDRMLTTMIDSMRSFCQLPPRFASELSILADLDENSMPQ